MMSRFSSEVDSTGLDNSTLSSTHLDEGAPDFAEHFISMRVVESLIESEDWDGVTAIFKSAPEAASQRIGASNLNKSLEYASYAGPGNFPLHLVCSHKEAPIALVNLLLELNLEAVRSLGQHGYLPLHCACAAGAKTEVVSRLIEVYPSATRYRDEVGGALPLHLAARSGAPEEALMEILCVYPEGSFMRDQAGMTALEYAKQLPENTRNSVLYVMETAPILVETAKNAAARVEKNYETRIKNLQEAHKEFIRHLEERQHAETKGFMQMEVQFHNELADEKERNISLAEIILEMQVQEKKLKKELFNTNDSLRVEREEHKARERENQLELKTILKGPLEMAGYEGDKPISTILADFASRYTESQAELTELREHEGMVRHLNQLLSSKDGEIRSLANKLSSKHDAEQLMTKRANRLQTLYDDAQHAQNEAQEENRRLRQVIETQQRQLQELNRKSHIQESRLGTIKNLISSLSYNIDTWSTEDNDFDRRNLGGQNSPVSLEGIERVRVTERPGRLIHPSKRAMSPDKSDCEKSLSDTHGTAGTTSTKNSSVHDEDGDMSSLSKSPARPRSIATSETDLELDED